MLEAKGAYYVRADKKSGRIIASINVSTFLARDSNFPFKHKDKLKIRINRKSKSLTIRKVEEDVSP